MDNDVRQVRHVAASLGIKPMALVKLAKDAGLPVTGFRTPVTTRLERKLAACVRGCSDKRSPTKRTRVSSKEGRAVHRPAQRVKRSPASLTTAGSTKGARDELRRQFTKSLGSSPAVPVNLSFPRHGTTTPVLREFVYGTKFRGRELPVILKDGSTPHPFPVGRLEETDEPQPVAAEHAIRVGLMSCRHPDLDYLVVRYVTRNKELAAESSLAEAEQLAFERTVELLSDPDAEEGAEIWAYHTGFEPMVLGFYRGVVHVLDHRAAEGLPRCLVVRPFFHKGTVSDGFSHQDTEGVKFDEDSSGAKHKNYRAEKPWW